MSRSWIVIGITSFQWDFTTGMEGEQEERREDVKEDWRYWVWYFIGCVAGVAIITLLKLAVKNMIMAYGKDPCRYCEHSCYVYGVDGECKYRECKYRECKQDNNYCNFIPTEPFQDKRREGRT